ncbi:MAG: hypothetical protein MUC48_13135 [Leptolyngbya sp. Prado105]|jgi:hypothetical protein|nr:hypothetical protein [Leptolyngbya sp. Prado105]
MVDTIKPSKITRLRAEKGGKDFVAFVALASLVVGGISLFFQFLLMLGYFGIANKPAPTLVQLSNGQAIKVGMMGNKERSLEVVQRFVTDSLILLMSWSNSLPPQVDANGNASLATDPGIKVKVERGEKLMTTSAFQASFTFSEKFRDELVKLVAEMTPDGVFTGQITTALVFEAVTVPELMGDKKDGRWKILVVGTLVQSTVGTGETTRIPFNKEVIVKAVDTPPLPEGGKFSSPFESAIYNIRQAGLEIVAMKDLEGSSTSSKLSVSEEKSDKPQKKRNNKNQE